MAYNLLGARNTYYVISGTSNPDGLDIRGWGKAYYDQTSSDLANNQSRIKLEFGVKIVGTWYGKYKVTGTIYKKVDSNWVSIASDTYTSNLATQNAGTYTKGTLTDKILPHDTNGNAQVRVGVTITGQSGVIGTESYLYIYDLPQISQQTQAGNLDLIVGDTTIYNINPMSINYNHSLRIDFKSNTYYVGENGVLTNTEYIFSGSNINVVCPTSFYSLFTTENDTTGSITLKTYNENVQIGQSSTGTLSVSVNPQECTPQITGTVEDVNSRTVTATGDSNIIIPYYSVVRVTPIIQASASADIGTTVVSKSVDGDAFTESYYTPTIIKKGYEVSVTNSRGLTNTVVLSTENILDYVKVTVNASSKFYRTSPTANNMYVDLSGTFWNDNFGAVRNTLNIFWYVKELSDSTYTLGGSFSGSAIAISNNTYSGSNIQLTCPLTGGWSYQKAYDFKIEAMDYLGSETLTTSIYKGKPIFYWYENNDANYFKVNGTLRADDIKISNGGLLDLIYPIGSIYQTADGTFNPSTTFGGTWSQIRDVFLLAAGNTYTGGDTGGSATHTHTLTDAYAMAEHSNAQIHFNEKSDVSWTSTGRASATSGATESNSYTDAFSLGGNTDSSSNLPPYEVVYMWKRTA